ncbi:hypothetical protein [Actinomadura roseirufa]|uniref:hypothetical protein n=1 Tax=Actinomadura roseirufa TaxID=2094049 RepID=UPI0010415149|nr:hypothetical protein [Actinomadura roseirufa]
MKDVGSVVIPIAVILILGGAITGSFVAYFRFERHRTETLARELERFRSIAQESVQQQKETQTRLAELSERVAAVEGLLRDIG